MDEQAADRLFITAITVAEVRYGLGIMPEGRRRTDLMLQADAMFAQALVSRCSPSRDVATAFATPLTAGRVNV
ncbi:MAG: hypothetical protein IT536_20075 [Hyphomicrobiales bacterium]|nr:hypothetical protein [Hyphomicrobiales bacterium]